MLLSKGTMQLPLMASILKKISNTEYAINTLKGMRKRKDINHCVKSVQIWSFSGPYFPVFSPNAGKYGPEKLCI